LVHNLLNLKTSFYNGSRYEKQMIGQVIAGGIANLFRVGLGTQLSIISKAVFLSH